MTREQLMQQVYDKNHFCSAGDIALALSKRFPRFQGNRKLADGSETKSHFQMASEFLMKKKDERIAKEKQDAAKQQEKSASLREFMFDINEFASEIAKDLRRSFNSEIRRLNGFKV